MSDFRELVSQLAGLDTEQPNPNTTDIDKLSALEVTRRINTEDKGVASVVEQALPQIAKCAELFALSIANGGKVIYVGAGTSGRLGVLDAAECPPTFGTDPSQIIGVIAGGYGSLTLSQEGVEDDSVAAKCDLERLELNRNDFVIGLAASRRTPYTQAALEHAASVGCATAFIVCNRAGSLHLRPDVLIELPVGPEVITGSTRMKSGTAQKMTLNMISTTAMILLGKTCGNLMVDLKARSEKLAARSRKILIDLLGISLGDAEKLLEQAGGSVKLAIVMHRFGIDRHEAARRLSEAGGFISRIT